MATDKEIVARFLRQMEEGLESVVEDVLEYAKEEKLNLLFGPHGKTAKAFLSENWHNFYEDDAKGIIFSLAMDLAKVRQQE